MESLRKKRQRRTTLRDALQQAAKAGAAVRGAVIDPSGRIELRFGEPDKATTNENPWDQEVEKLSKQK
jgi:hypothetical protein